MGAASVELEDVSELIAAWSKVLPVTVVVSQPARLSAAPLVPEPAPLSAGSARSPAPLSVQLSAVSPAPFGPTMTVTARPTAMSTMANITRVSRPAIPRNLRPLRQCRRVSVANERKDPFEIFAGTRRTPLAPGGFCHRGYCRAGYGIAY